MEGFELFQNKIK